VPKAQAHTAKLIGALLFFGPSPAQHPAALRAVPTMSVHEWARMLILAVPIPLDCWTHGWHEHHPRLTVVTRLVQAAVHHTPLLTSKPSSFTLYRVWVTYLCIAQFLQWLAIVIRFMIRCVHNVLWRWMLLPHPRGMAFFRDVPFDAAVPASAIGVPLFPQKTSADLSGVVIAAGWRYRRTSASTFHCLPCVCRCRRLYSWFDHLCGTARNPATITGCKLFFFHCFRSWLWLACA
jgi:hypothetical protein